MTADLEIPDTMSPEAADLLIKLLDRNPDTRLQVRYYYPLSYLTIL